MKLTTKKLFAWLLFLTIGLCIMSRIAHCQTKPADTQRQGDRLYRISQGVLWGGTLADWYSSRPTPGTREANPSMSGNRAAQAALMAGGSAMIHFMSSQMHKQGHRKAAKILNFIAGGIHAGAGVYNEILSARQK